MSITNTQHISSDILIMISEEIEAQPHCLFDSVYTLRPPQPPQMNDCTLTHSLLGGKIIVLSLQSVF